MIYEKRSDVIETLKKFKALSSDHRNHQELLKSKKVLLYVATLMDKVDVIIIGLCLDILENFISNGSCRITLVSTFGVYESVESLSLRIRNVDEKLYIRAIEITEILRTSAPPAMNTRSKTKGQGTIKRNPVFLLFIEKLTKENQQILESALIKIKGVISFILDLELKRVTVRICSKVTVKEVIEKIYNKTSMKPLILIKNVQEGTEAACDILETSAERSYFEYTEEEFAPRAKAITTSVGQCIKTGNNLIKSIANFWNESFYW